MLSRYSMYKMEAIKHKQKKKMKKIFVLQVCIRWKRSCECGGMYRLWRTPASVKGRRRRRENSDLPLFFCSFLCCSLSSRSSSSSSSSWSESNAEEDVHTKEWLIEREREMEGGARGWTPTEQ